MAEFEKEVLNCVFWNISIILLNNDLSDLKYFILGTYKII